MPRSGEQTRRTIVETAKDLFYRRGYFNTSFTDIVEATGIQRGNITHYFKTKEDILDAVVAARRAEYRDTLDEWARRDVDPRKRLKRFADMVFANREHLIRYGCPIGTLNTELGKEDSGLGDAATGLFDLFRDWLRDQFMALGLEPADAMDHAIQLLSWCEGISLVGHVYEDEKLIKRQTAMIKRWIDEV